MKAGDLVSLARGTKRLDSNDDSRLWMVLKEEDYNNLCVFVVNVKTGARGWVPKDILKVVSKCQENVKSASNALRSSSCRVTL